MRHLRVGNVSARAPPQAIHAAFFLRRKLVDSSPWRQRRSQDGKRACEREGITVWRHVSPPERHVDLCDELAQPRQKEYAMKLSFGSIDRTLIQFSAQAVPNEHPAVEQFRSNFGDHTFFLDGNGLHIVEPGEPYPNGALTGRVVKLASWTDASKTSLAPHERVYTDIVVALDEAA
jgi:hypothetical protein